MKRLLLVLSSVTLAGCMLTPARFKQPSPRYTASAKPVRIAVVGFEYDQFRATGVSHASSYGAAASSGTVTGSGYGWQVDGKARSGAAWGSQAHAVQGEYVTRTLAPEVAAAFANTGCFQVVMGPNAEPDYVFEGRPEFTPIYTGLHYCGFLIVFV